MDWKKLRLFYLRRIPRKRHFRGTFLHRVAGERLFDPQLWKPSRSSVAGGLAIGLFIAFTPTLGVQMALAALAAFFLRVNIPIAVLACWLTNPLTAPVIYTLQYRLGLWCCSSLIGETLRQPGNPLSSFIFYGKPLWIGSLISGAFFTTAGYLVVFFGWEWIEKFRLRLFPRKRFFRSFKG